MGAVRLFASKREKETFASARNRISNSIKMEDHVIQVSKNERIHTLAGKHTFLIPT